jgi:hypothetical protein
MMGRIHPPGLETPHNTDIVHYFLDQRNGVLTRAVIGGNKGVEKHTGKEPDDDHARENRSNADQAHSNRSC